MPFDNHEHTARACGVLYPDLLDAPDPDDPSRLTKQDVESTRIVGQPVYIEHDYGMEGGVLCVTTRGKLVPYALKLLHIDHRTEKKDPTAQQITLENRTALEQWLFD